MALVAWRAYLAKSVAVRLGSTETNVHRPAYTGPRRWPLKITRSNMVKLPVIRLPMNILERTHPYTSFSVTCQSVTHHRMEGHRAGSAGPTTTSTNHRAALWFRPSEARPS